MGYRFNSCSLIEFVRSGGDSFGGTGRSREKIARDSEMGCRTGVGGGGGVGGIGEGHIHVRDA